MVDVRELGPEDAAELTALYGDYAWWADRNVEDVRRALAETDLALGAFEDAGHEGSIGVEAGGAEAGVGEGGEGIAGERGVQLVGAARVLTDFTYYGKVYDVIVAADRRHAGVGRALLTALLDHPDLQDLPGIALLCREGLVPFYESIGFHVFDPEVEIPEGGTEELVRMTIEFEDSG